MELEGGRWTHVAIQIGQETRVHATRHLDARLVEGGLCEGVVLLLEGEVDHVANGRYDGVGSVDVLLASNHDLGMSKLERLSR